MGLRFEGSELIEAVSSRPGARAFRVRSRDGEIAEDPLRVRYLGDASREQRPTPPDIAEWRALALARRRR